jgi:hypothetical protein
MYLEELRNVTWTHKYDIRSYAEIRKPTSQMWNREWIWMHHSQQDAASQVDAKYFTRTKQHRKTVHGKLSR